MMTPDETGLPAVAEFSSSKSHVDGWMRFSIQRVSGRPPPYPLINLQRVPELHPNWERLEFTGIQLRPLNG